MDQINFTVDTTELENLVSYFSNKDWMRVKRKALTKAGNKIKRKARQNFKSKLPRAGMASEKYTDKLTDAIRSKRLVANGLGELSLTVHTMGTNKKGSGTFRARFFEKSTQERYTKKQYVDSLGRVYPAGQYRGRIQPALNFFQNAVSSLNYAEQDMMSIIEDEIVKLNNKKF